MAYASSHKVFQKKYLLTNSQVAELWKIREHKFKHYSILTEMRALLLNSSVILVIKKRFSGKFGGLEFSSKFYPEVALANYARTQIRLEEAMLNFA
jgi:hypothetical protein